MKKYLILALSAVLVIIAILWGYAAFNGLYGTWINVNPQPGNIFDGNVKIEKIKNKQGAQQEYFTVLSDWQNHALSCSPAEGQKDVLLCLPFLKSPNPVTKDTTYDQIVVETSMAPLFLQIKRQNYLFYHVIDMEMSYVGPSCPQFGDKGCNYVKFPRYTRWGL